MAASSYRTTWGPGRLLGGGGVRTTCVQPTPFLNNIPKLTEFTKKKLTPPGAAFQLRKKKFREGNFYLVVNIIQSIPVVFTILLLSLLLYFMCVYNDVGISVEKAHWEGVENMNWFNWVGAFFFIDRGGYWD